MTVRDRRWTLSPVRKRGAGFAHLLPLFLLSGCSLAPSTQKQANDLKNKITNAVGEVGELRNTVTTQIENVQNEAKWWLGAVIGVTILAMTFPCLLLFLLAWTIRKWLDAQTKDVCSTLKVGGSEQ